MRKVEIVKREYISGGDYVMVPTGEAGYFHRFGIDHEEYETGPGNYPVAIIEMPTGNIKIVYAEFIRFLEPDHQASHEG